MKTLLAAAAAAVALTPLSVRADEPALAQGRHIQVAVAYGDLDLDSEHGVQVLLGRLAHASMEACGAFEGSLIDYRAGVAASRCFRSEMDQAAAELGAPRVAATYQAAGPRAFVRRQ